MTAHHAINSERPRLEGLHRPVERGFISFSTHDLMHMVPALWRVHRVHHLDTELDTSLGIEGDDAVERCRKDEASLNHDGRRFKRSPTQHFVRPYPLAVVPVTIRPRDLENA